MISPDIISVTLQCVGLGPEFHKLHIRFRKRQKQLRPAMPVFYRRLKNKHLHSIKITPGDKYLVNKRSLHCNNYWPHEL